MRKIRSLWQFAFDVRPGERLRVLFISLYLLSVLWAYYILKPVSRAMFLARFNIDDLPWLYILIAAAGGILAMLYTRVAVRASLTAAVTWATVASVACLVAIWWVLQYPIPWMLYVFNVWVSLFSIVVVTQGWLVAANVFDSREAKRLYGLIGLSPVIGAAFGGSFTTFALQFTGERHLLLASAVMVLLAYGSFRCLLLLKGVSLRGASAADSEEANFSVMEILAPLRTHRHLQVIMAITTVMFIVDTSIDFQFNAMAKAKYASAKELTAFMGTFNGIYLNAVNFTLQFFLSAIVVRWLGVGGVLQIMPATISAAAFGSLVSPGLGTAATAKLSESALRYTFNKTAMELLYLPLPTELKNRTKAFVDIFIDRLGRGIGGVLILFMTGVLGMTVGQVPYLTLLVVAIWAFLAWHAQKEYFRTVRGRLESRRLTLEDARITVNDPAMVKMLEQAAGSANPRQATYALGLLADAPGYQLEPLLGRLTKSPLAEVRKKAYDLAAASKLDALIGSALEEVRTAGTASQAAATYALAVSPDPEAVAREFLGASNCEVVRGAIYAVAANTKLAALVPNDWVLKEASDPLPERRALAALGYGIRAHGSGEPPNPETLHKLIVDRDATVASEACRVAGWTRNRAFVHPLVERLPHGPVRAAAVEGLAAYGAGVCGTLGDLLADDSVPLTLRRQIPRVLKMVPDQRSVDVLLANIDQRDLRLRHAVLKGLNRLRESAPNLVYNGQVVTAQILNEARRYFELHAALVHLREAAGPRSACELLAKTVDERLGQIIERLFRLLGLRYPHREIYASYLAIHHHRTDEFSAAIEFLDNVLDRDLKKVIIPMLDNAGSMTVRGLDLFGVEVPDAEAAIKSLIRTGDPWLVACAVASAAERNLRRLAPDVREAAERNETEVAQVARSAAAALV